MKDQTLFADGFNDAIIGLSEEWMAIPRIVYSKVKMVDILIEEGMSHEEAVEYLEYNVWGAYVGEGTPVWVNDFNGTSRAEVEELLEMITPADDAD